jgi:Rieske Fe-S protein
MSFYVSKNLPTIQKDIVPLATDWNDKMSLLPAEKQNELLAVKDFISSKGIIVVRIADGNLASSFVAFFNACTHEGAAVEYDADTNGFICPRHFATFSISGAVTGAPAPAPLTARTVAVSGSTLTVK